MIDYSIQRDKAIIIKKNGEIKQILVESIIYIKCDGNLSTFYISNKSSPETFFKSLKECEEELSKYGFFRINRSSLINMKYFESLKYENYDIILSNLNIQLQISRRKLPVLKRYIEA